MGLRIRGRFGKFIFGRFARRSEFERLASEVRELALNVNHLTVVGLHAVHESAVGVAREHAEAAAEVARESAVGVAREHAEAAAEVARESAVGVAREHAEAAAEVARESAVGVAREHAEAAAEVARESAVGVAREEIRRAMADLSRKLQRLEIVLNRPDGFGQSVSVGASESHAVSDVLYAEIEDRFRGSSDEIRTRQSHYLELVETGVAESGGLPVLDVGCGRGEFLDLLQESAIEASGVDGNWIFVEEGRQRGLVIDQLDALEALSARADESLGVISVFHLVEHLSLDYLSALLGECARTLHPAGVLLIETPNCGSLSVTGGTFWIDPTHLRPLHPEVLRFLVHRAGFSSVELKPLHSVIPSESFATHLEAASELESLLADAVFGFGDLAVTARR